jgi:cobalt-zinc-cadmium efflux system outer membrane protein
LLELRVQLPLQVNYSFEGEIKRAKEQLTQTQLMLDKVKLLATTELQSLLQNVLTSHDRHLRYEEMILPQAKKVLEQAEFAYSKGALTLTDLLDARRTFRATRIEAISSQSELLKAQASWYLRTEPFEIEQLSNLN